MKKILVYENPEHTMQLKILEDKPQDLYEAVMPKRTIKVALDDREEKFDLIEIEYITK